MEPASSLSHSQDPITCTYPEPDQSSQCFPSYFLKTSFNIILSCTYGSSKWSLSLRFPHQKPLFTHPLPTRPTCPAHLTLLDMMAQIIYNDKYRSWSSSLCSYLHSSVTSLFLGPNIFLSILLSNTLGLFSSLNVTHKVSLPYKTKTIDLPSTFLPYQQHHR
jgi:hypothetical protein